MSSVLRVLGVCTAVVAVSACQPKVEPVKPTADQQASLERLHKNCIAASPGQQGLLINMPRHRKSSMQFNCDDMKFTCETDYASDLCKGQMTVSKIESAFHQVCRTSRKAASSSACNKLSDCTAAVEPYNR